MNEVRRSIAEEVAKIPRPTDGAPGRDGESVSLADLSGEIIKAATTAVAALPRPEKGDPGRDVDMDAITKAVEELVSEKVGDIADHLSALHECAMDDLQQQKAAAVESLAMTVSAEVAKALAAQSVPTIDPADIEAAAQRVMASMPPPKDGAPGKDVDMTEVMKAIEVLVAEIPHAKDGAPGKDGTSVTVEDIEPLLEAAQAKWALDMERRAADMLHQAIQHAVDNMPVAKDGKDGKDGRDALPFEGLRGEFDHEKSVMIFTYTVGGVEGTVEVPVGVPIDRGIFRTAHMYARGSFVTYGGGMWSAQRDTDRTPGTPDSGWRLAVKSPRGKG